MSSIVIYFSRSGENYFGGQLKNIEKGNTEVIAEYIKDLTDAELFKVEPASAYPEDYMECIDVAKKEQQNGARPELKETLDDILAYNLHRFSKLVGNTSYAHVYSIGTA